MRLQTAPNEKERSRKADIVIFAKEEWQRMKGSSSSAAAYTPPPGVIEVVSTNWKDDYLTKLAEYQELGVLEYIIVDYAPTVASDLLGHRNSQRLQFTKFYRVYQRVNVHSRYRSF